MSLSARERTAIAGLREVASELERAGAAGLCGELEVWLSSEPPAPAVAVAFLEYVLEVAASIGRASPQERSSRLAALEAQAAGVARVQAEAFFEAAVDAAAAQLREAATEQGKRLALALPREIEAHPRGLLRAELPDFLADRLALFAQRAATAQCEVLAPELQRLREAYLPLVATPLGDPSPDAEAALHLLHGELGELAEDARATARTVVAARLEGASIGDSAVLGETRFKARLCEELPERVRGAGSDLGARLADRARARGRQLVVELGRHCAAHRKIGLGLLAADAPLDEERRAQLASRCAAARRDLDLGAG